MKIATTTGDFGIFCNHDTDCIRELHRAGFRYIDFNMYSTLTQWMFGWAMKGWLKSDNKTPENLDLIQAFYKHWQNGYRIDLKKVKGHSGQKFNELADKLAVRRN